MPNPLHDCEPFFPNKHNSHAENHSWQLMAHELPGPRLSASRMFTDGPDLYVSEVPGQSALVAVREHPRTCPNLGGLSHNIISAFFPECAPASNCFPTASVPRTEQKGVGEVTQLVERLPVQSPESHSQRRWVWGCTAVITVLGKERQEEKFKVIFYYRTSMKGQPAMRGNSG